MPVSVVEEDKQTIISAVCTSHMKQRQLLKHLSIHPSTLQNIRNAYKEKTDPAWPSLQRLLWGILVSLFTSYEFWMQTFFLISYRRLILAILNEVFILWHQKWDELYSHLIMGSWSSVRSLNKLWKSLKSAQA